ncbi:hypothetical protein QZH41_020560, partial [Actinostola sp. cb2023]
LSKKNKEGQVVTTDAIESESEDMDDEDDVEEYASEKDDEHLTDTRQAVLDKIDATDTPYGYLMFDFETDTPDALRLRTNIFPTDTGPQEVYVDKGWTK